MTRFIPREKLSKKARRELDAQRRRTWAFSPIMKKIESRKQYNRKRLSYTSKPPAHDAGGDFLSGREIGSLFLYHKSDLT